MEIYIWIYIHTPRIQQYDMTHIDSYIYTCRVKVWWALRYWSLWFCDDPLSSWYFDAQSCTYARKYAYIYRGVYDMTQSTMGRDLFIHAESRSGGQRVCMRVCVCVCVWVCVGKGHGFRDKNIWKHINVNTHMHTCTCIYKYTRAHTCIWLHTSYRIQQRDSYMYTYIASSRSDK